MEKAEQSPQVKATRLKGVDLRSSRATLDNGSFDRVWGMYPRQTNLLSRIPGKFLLRILEGRDIFRMRQTFDGNGNIVVQNGDQIDLIPLDDFLNRSQTSNLTPASSVLEEDMSYALLLHVQTVGTDGGDLSSAGADNTFGKGTLNVEASDEDGIVSLSSSQFTLSTGIYRMRATVLAGSNNNTATSTKCILWSATAGAPKTNANATGYIIGVGTRTAGTAVTNLSMRMRGRFEVTAASEVFEIRMAGLSGVTWYTNTNAQGAASGISSGSYDEVYKMIEILKEP